MISIRFDFYSPLLDGTETKNEEKEEEGDDDGDDDDDDEDEEENKKAWSPDRNRDHCGWRVHSSLANNLKFHLVRLKTLNVDLKPNERKMKSKLLE